MPTTPTVHAVCPRQPSERTPQTLRKLLEIVYWPTKQQDVWEFCKNCAVYQHIKPHILKFSSLLQTSYMLGVDLMGPFPKSSQQKEYILVVVDYGSKWVELFPLRSQKNPIIANILIKDFFTWWGTSTYLDHRSWTPIYIPTVY